MKYYRKVCFNSGSNPIGKRDKIVTFFCNKKNSLNFLPFLRRNVHYCNDLHKVFKVKTVKNKEKYIKNNNM